MSRTSVHLTETPTLAVRYHGESDAVSLTFTVEQDPFGAAIDVTFSALGPEGREGMRDVLVEALRRLCEHMTDDVFSRIGASS